MLTSQGYDLKDLYRLFSRRHLEYFIGRMSHVDDLLVGIKDTYELNAKHSSQVVIGKVYFDTAIGNYRFNVLSDVFDTFSGTYWGPVEKYESDE